MTFKDLSIKRKIIYLYLPLAIIPMIIFAGISMKFYESAIIKRSLSSMSDNNVLISDRIDGILSEAEGSATLLTISINRLLNSATFHGTLSDDIKLYNLISNELTYAKLIYKYIDSIGFIDVDNRLYYSDYELQNGKNAIVDSEMYETLRTTTGNSVWFELSNRDFLTRSPDQKMLTLGKKIWNINTGATIGYLFVNIDEQVFSNLISGQLADYDIYNTELNLLTTTITDGERRVKVEPFLNGTITSDIMGTSGERTLISKIQIDKLGWTLLSKADLNLFTQDLANIILLIIIMLITIILLEITMTLALNRLITNPIMKLKNGVEEISRGNFDYRFKMKTNDEIGLFAMSFNHMSAQIKKLLFDVEREEKKKREYELALIQQQIKPHFLYNTLDIILKLSQLGQERKAQKVTRRLADYYRNSLSGGADVISVKDELKITLDYLELQKLRYSDVFDYRIEVSPLMESIMIPKLSLQPIVENAIEHGFKYLSETGLIRIFDEMREDAYEIIVADNGVGMSEEHRTMLNQVLSAPSDHQTIRSFGIKNVSHRMKLFFGHEYGIYIVSEAGKGTEIRIRLPKDGQYD